MVEAFLDQGWAVSGCARSAQAITELNDSGLFRAIDVASDADVRGWVNEVINQVGAPDLLLNNAAIINANASFWDVPVDEFDAVIDINIKGVANVCRHFLPAMIERGSGVIVNFSSGWGRSTAAEVAPYCATKYAIEGLTQALAQELPRGLAAIPLNPGIINTQMLQSCFAGGASSFPTADEWVQQAVPFLMKLDATHNGQSLTAPQ